MSPTCFTRVNKSCRTPEKNMSSSSSSSSSSYILLPREVLLPYISVHDRLRALALHETLKDRVRSGALHELLQAPCFQNLRLVVEGLSPSFSTAGVRKHLRHCAECVTWKRKCLVLRQCVEGGGGGGGGVVVGVLRVWFIIPRRCHRRRAESGGGGGGGGMSTTVVFGVCAEHDRLLAATVGADLDLPMYGCLVRLFPPCGWYNGCFLCPDRAVHR
jgi:hypothetical protein